MPERADNGARDGGKADGGRSIEPPGLTITALPGGNGVLEVTALTLRHGPTHLEVYAALHNVGDRAACSAALSVELFDWAEQSLATGINGLLSARFYRLTDGSDATAACIGPGDVAMAAITDMPSDIAVEDVGHLVYRCPYFALDVEPLGRVDITDVTGIDTGAGTAYSGRLVNGLAVPLDNPSVTLFPTNPVGRPLGMTTASDEVTVPPGGSWAFKTAPLRVPGAVDHAAYPSGALAR